MNRISWKCPNCGAPLLPQLSEKPYTLRCAARHSFDIAKQGYVNLLLPQKRGAALPGDSPEMVHARTAFLSGGYYQAFSDNVNALIGDTLANEAETAPVIADAGCGEGYYTARLCEALCARGMDAACVGFDLAKEAVAHGARCAKAFGTADRLSYAVASLFAMPVADRSLSFVINLFAPVAAEEFARVLKAGGHVLIAVPAERHLWGLKEALYETPYENEVRRDILPHFTLTEVRRVRDTVTVNGTDHIRALFSMTPYYWKTSAADAAKLNTRNTLTTEIAFDLLLYRKDAHQ